MSDAGQVKPRRFRVPLRGLIPAAASALFGVFLWQLLHPAPDLPSVLIGKSVPEFALPAIAGRAEGFSTADLQGQVALVNIFASWCVPCRAEHPVISALVRSGVVPVFGINYKDEAPNALAWLKELGNPYARIGADTDGRVAIELGAYGVPETYVVGADGIIAYRVVGPITQTMVDETLLPLIRSLQQKTAKAES
ncbi:MAG TPA: DsbE family thiol:disulfide interchange protein [Albidovulum sp.]|uniref:DsbE family thiol:disulfide interchange protein n=1 Tax=Albidovulum sp. TaxID=1872424 RepID=UPI002C56F807|nr:DsbE family thiol:disulfide interchange protein [Albidovulum sp.]